MSVVTTGLALLGGLLAAAAGADDATRARQILDATGVQGGLVVHVGCGDGRLTAALRAGDSYLVHGLSSDADQVEKARRQIQTSPGAYGPVSVDEFDGRHLPYVDNLVNLLVAEDLGGVAREEVLRVLVPRGVAYVKQDGQWTKTVKPWPGDIDEWTHWLHDAGQSAVARDSRVGPPRRVQWIAEPLWSRGHEVISSIGAIVTARGRLFSVVDEGPTGIYSFPSQWALVARDAFNGVLLWKRPLPHWSAPVVLGGFANGFQPERLATDGRHVFLPLGEAATLSVLDASNGATIKTLDAARGTSQILCDGGLLVAVARPGAAGKAARKEQQPAGAGLRVFRADTGEPLWSAPAAPQAVALAAGRLFTWDKGGVAARDAKSGAELWHTPFAAAAAKGKKRAADPTLRVYRDTVYVEGGSRLAALAAADGKALWERKDSPVSRGELFAVGSLLWRPQGNKLFGHDAATGEVRATIDAAKIFTEGHHPRCYPCKATERYVITNNRGAEFVSLTSDEQVENDWLRGSCGHGIVPANGLLYVPPNPCFCYPGAKITGFNALAPQGHEQDAGDAAPRLVKGPAYQEAQRKEFTSNPQVPTPNPSDWPTYRHDAARSGAAACDVSPDVAAQWTADLHGRLTAPVVCDGRLYVAAKDRHMLLAIATADGRPLWQYTAGGRIDSPPSIFGELVLFGCADGRVYCLRARDGALVWRFQAAPSTRRMVAFGQLESPWRVHGSVLIHDGLAYFTAGRSSYLDGGLRIFALQPATGEVVYQTRIDTWSPTRDDAQGKPFVAGYHIEGAQSDILVSQGGAIYLGQMKFDGKLRQQAAPYVLPDPTHKTTAMDLAGQPFVVENEEPQNDYEEHQRQWIESTQKKLVAQLRQQHGSFNYGVRRMGLHLLATSGLLDDAWFNRTYWMYADVWPGFYLAHRAAKAGQLLVVGPEKTYAVQAFPSRNLQSPLFTPGRQGYLLLADANDNEPLLDDKTVEVTKGWGFTRAKPPAWFDWAPIRIRGMVLAGPALFVAGPPDVVDSHDPPAALEGRRGGVLRVYAAADGKKLAEHKLDAPPLLDGLVAAAGRLFLATVDGKVVCLGGAK